MLQKIALLGFGTVGQGLVEILHERGDHLKDSIGLNTRVVAITDMMKGAIYHPDGLDLSEVMKAIKEKGSLDDYPSVPGLIRGWDSFQTIRESNADTVVEVTYTDVKTGQPAIDHCKQAFESGKNVVMSNKGPVALAYKELLELSNEHNVRWGFEGTVMSGTPALRLPLTSLVGNNIREISGVLNGTTNYILTKMEEGISYDKALSDAQALGYAEADPTSDVEGYDAMYKIVILANLVMNAPLKKEDVACQGISHLTLDDIEAAAAEGKRWRMIAKATKEGDQISAKVGPELIDASNPLAGLQGGTNAVTYDCDLLGPVTLVGAGAGRMETGFSLLIDLINVGRGQI
jgi:homoserine dehydrogenase